MVQSSDGVPALVAWLQAQNDCVLEPGLTDSELSEAQDRFGIEFSELWVSVLQAVHPVAVTKPPRNTDGLLDWVRYPDWRGREEDETRRLIAWPCDGILFDVEHNGFWWQSWGDKPTLAAERVGVARRALEHVPRLVPVRGSWYVASSSDSPVFSIHQTDLYCFATSLCGLPDGDSEDAVELGAYPIGTVPFWSQLHAWSQIGHLDSSFGTLATNDPASPA